MKLNKAIITCTIFSLLVSLSSSSNIGDFCVAKMDLPVTPTGFPCKNSANVNVDDFVFSGLGVAANTSNLFNATTTFAVETTFPGLNGLGLSMTRLDFGVDGVIQMHTHPSASELLILTEGEIISGFIASDNTAYYKTLNKGDIMIFPPGLIHFQVNVGKTPAIAFTSLNSAQPGFQAITPSFAANDLPTDIIKKTTLFDSHQVKKLKSIFGGTN